LIAYYLEVQQTLQRGRSVAIFSMQERAVGTAEVDRFRPDIQGLRAVAVVAVILNHLFSWPSGAFVGVDVFFVISGFLITGLMLREHEKTGRISWTGFYRRRVRRIVPAATVCLVATVAAAYFLYRTARFDAVRGDAIWAFFFASNWHSAAVGTDYLQANGPISPLQHYWSLAVEEQFYIVWPILVVVVLGVVGRPLLARGRSARKLLGVVMGAVVVTSFAWAMWETGNSPTWAYFSTFARGWELAIGAMLALTMRRLAQLPASVRSVLSWLGLLTIVVSFFVITPASAFPGPWAALPVVGAAAVIAAGVGGTPRHAGLLTNRLSVYVGKISYSLYLWHFPVIVLLEAVMPAGTTEYVALSLAGMAVLSIASFHLVEDPVRRSGWLESAETKATLTNAKRHERSHRSGVGGPTEHRRKHKGSVLNIALPILAIITAVMVVKALQVPTVDVTASVAVADTSSATSSDASAAVVPVVSEAQRGRTAEIVTALAATEWPDLTPSLDDLGHFSRVPEWVTDGCLAAGDPTTVGAYQERSSTRCIYGDPEATKTAVLLGDSVAISYAPGIRKALPGWRIVIMAMEQCPLADVSVNKGDGSPHAACPGFRQWTLSRVAELNPDLVLTSAQSGTWNRISDKPTEAEKTAEWAEGMNRSLTQLAPLVGRTIVFGPPPGSENLQNCATTLSTPADCQKALGDHYQKRVLPDLDAVIAEGAKYVDVQDWFCAGQACPAFVGTAPEYADGGHLTQPASEALAPLIFDAVNTA
jgi:peptidoglycan/LPS O-acetylase OafA/YrhL